MDLDLNATISLFEEFKATFEQANPNLDKSKQLMDRLKLAITKFSFPGLTSTSAEESQKQLVLCREVLEYGALLSVAMKDIPSFERYFAQLRTYYFDYASRLPPSQRQPMILGLQLLHSLAKNTLDEFHTLLELIPVDQQNTVFIKHPIQLEQYMMEGAYNKVQKAKNDIPSQSYAYFMDLLMHTVRNEIAECCVKAYNHLSVADAQKLLGFSNAQELKTYSTNRGWTISSVTGEEAVMFKTDDVADAPKTEISQLKLIKQTLHYARELERIV